MMHPSARSKILISDKFKELQDSVLIKLSKVEAKKETLTELKNHFKEKIGSRRAFDRIRDFEGLFNVLKKRDELSYDKLEPFKDVSDIIRDKNLREKISELEKEFENFEIRGDNLLFYENGKFPSPSHRENCCRLKLLEEKIEAEEEIDRVISKQQQQQNRKKNRFLRNEDEKNSNLRNSGKNKLLDPEKNIFAKEKVLSKLSARDPLLDEAEARENNSVNTMRRRKKRTLKSHHLIICTFVMAFVFFFAIALIYDLISPRFAATPTVKYDNISQKPHAQSSSSQVTVQSPNLLLGFHSQESKSIATSSTETEIQKLVLNRISCRIGNRWRDLARYLDVREVDIDAIDIKYHRDLKEKAYQALKISQSQYSSQKWKLELMRALEKVRRKDLRDWIEENYYCCQD